MSSKAIIVLDADGLDDELLAAAGLHAGQTVVAEATDAGLLLRAPSDAELATSDRVSPAEVAAVLRRYPSTIDRLGR